MLNWGTIFSIDGVLYFIVAPTVKGLQTVISNYLFACAVSHASVHTG